MAYSAETIAAIATPPGKGGVGIVRVSGPLVKEIIAQIVGGALKPRVASFRSFCQMDCGLAIFFQSPHSFTGEDVLELQGHGGPVVMDLLLQRVLACGARLARPGEFSERAFLNGKIDLAQAEAVADLIDAATVQAAGAASLSLQGAFSAKIDDLASRTMQLRVMVEAAIDFPEEEIDFLTAQDVSGKIQALIEEINIILSQAKQGQLLKEGMRVAIVGQPNAGKSSLLNRLTQQETAIVTPIPGTTRDVIKETIQIDGLPIHLVDTAGIRFEGDEIEQEGIRRSQGQQALADRILLVIDASGERMMTEIEEAILKNHSDKVSIVMNKIDKTQDKPGERGALFISAKTGEGMASLLEHLKQCAGFKGESGGIWLARTRHIHALQAALCGCEEAYKTLTLLKAPELVAESLRQAQLSLGEIVGKVTSDALLGEIFSNFCIGK